MNGLKKVYSPSQIVS